MHTLAEKRNISFGNDILTTEILVYDMCVYTNVGYVWIGLSKVNTNYALHPDFIDDCCHGNQCSIATS